MNFNGYTGMMSDDEIKKMHRQTLKIIAEFGAKIENGALLKRLADAGADVSLGDQTVRFSEKYMEKFLAETEPYDWAGHKPVLRSNSGIFEGKYLDVDGKYLDWTEELVAGYAKFAHYMPNVDSSSMLGCPIKGIELKSIPLYQRYICWKYGMRAGGSIWDVKLCPYLLDMADIMAEVTGKPRENFISLNIFMISPLKFGGEELEHMMWFVDRGYEVGISHMNSIGGTSPVTLAGAVAIYLAEALIVNIIRRVLYGKKDLFFGCSVSSMDMMTGGFTYGRPEKALANVMTAQMARFYKGTHGAQSGLTDAKVPGNEAGVQKMLTVLPTLIYSGAASINAGLLSIDEVCSPLQMILDNESIGAVRRLVQGCGFKDEDFAVEELKEVGHGGMFMDKDHTVMNFRNEMFDSRLWTSKLLAGWLGGDRKSDMDKAMDVYHEIDAKEYPPQIDEETQKKLLALINKANSEF